MKPDQKQSQPTQSTAALQTQIDLLKTQIDGIKTQIDALTTMLGALRASVITKDSRVRIQNFEGCLKTYAALPTDLSAFKDGSIFLIDDGGATHKIGVLIAGTIRSVAVS